MRKVILGIVAFAGLLAACRPATEVYDLTCEGLAGPLAIDSTQPHFSWKIASKAPTAQTAYQIQVALTPSLLKKGALLGDTGRVESADQVMVACPGLPLHARCLYCWRVRVWDAEGKASRWSAPQRFGVGIIGADTLTGRYIGAVPGDGRSPLLRKRFRYDGRAQAALLHVNSLGYHEAYINGEKVSDAVLAPAVSQLDKRSLIVTYDVTRLLRRGENDIVFWTSPGWYKEGTFEAVYPGPLVKAELDLIPVRDPEAPVVLLGTDVSWEGAWSGYRDYDSWKPHHFGGEVIDARVVPSSLRRKDLDRLEWGPVAVVEVEGIAATPQMCEPCRVQETVQAVSVTPEGEGRWVVDFGRVLNAMPDLRLPSLPAGHVTVASFTDHILPDGTREIYSANRYISSGAPGGDRFANRFNHHVFRYIVLDSLPKAPALKDLQAHRMRTDYRRSASFACSDEELNRIHDMVAYTLENLAFDGYMVDCANIERLGYGGDGNASTLSLQELAGVGPLYVNWLQAWIDSQQEDGGLPHTAPCPYKAGGGPYWCGFIVQAPWRTWMSYGDPRLLERCHEAMLRWIGYVDKYAVDGMLLMRNRWPGTDYRTWFLGDWAAPPEYVDVMDEASVDLVNNCSLCQVYADLDRIARVLGKPEEADAFCRRLSALQERIHRTFYHPEDGTYGTGSQIDMVYPLLVGAVPDSLVPAVRDRLVERTAQVYDGHLVTGLVGVPVLTEWATLAGECDWMYGLLKQHGYPGYLYMLDNGATGTWEHWDAERSRLHNCFNGIGSWFYQALGGLIPDAPGYRHVRIEPQIPAGLEWVRMSQETPYGPIVIRREGKALHFELPVGVTATVRGQEYGCGNHDLKL